MRYRVNSVAYKGKSSHSSSLIQSSRSTIALALASHDEVDETPRYRNLSYDLFSQKQFTHPQISLDRQNEISRREARIRRYPVTELSVDLDDILSAITMST